MIVGFKPNSSRKELLMGYAATVPTSWEVII
jgi:hypothetical protein